MARGTPDHAPIPEAPMVAGFNPRVVSATQTITATGEVVFHTVPTGRRWRIYAVEKDHVSGTFDADNVIIRDTSEAEQIIAATFFSPGVDGNFRYETPLPLDQGDEVRMNISSVTASGDLTVKLLVEEFGL